MRHCSADNRPFPVFCTSSSVLALPRPAPLVPSVTYTVWPVSDAADEMRKTHFVVGRNTSSNITVLPALPGTWLTKLQAQQI
jgi:hypothetical protein